MQNYTTLSLSCKLVSVRLISKNKFLLSLNLRLKILTTIESAWYNLKVRAFPQIG
jgi:hypothetical protein